MRKNPKYKKQNKNQQRAPHAIRLFGYHPVLAALKNPARKALKLYVTRDAMNDRSLSNSVPQGLDAQTLSSNELSSLLPQSAVHQGVALDVLPLASPPLEDLIGKDGVSVLLMLDQVTDPHNVGAIMRSALAFGAQGLITTDRNSAVESGTLAKSASGALEQLPWTKVTNLKQALKALADHGYWSIALDGEADQSLSAIEAGDKICLILGAEGKGLREGTRKHADFMARIPMTGKIESLNVSNAAAVALYILLQSSLP